MSKQYVIYKGGRTAGTYNEGALYELIDIDKDDDELPYRVRDNAGLTYWERKGPFEIVAEVQVEAPKPKKQYPEWHLMSHLPRLDDNTRRTIKKQKEVADIVLERLRVLDENSILAGGALRNWDLNTPANDLDFYLYVGDHRQCGAVKKALEFLFGDIDAMGLTKADLEDVTQEERKDCPYDCMDIRWVFQGEFMGETCQFIFMKEPTFNSVVDHFDSSICKIWCTDTRYIRKEPEYHATMNTGVVFVKDPEGLQNRHLDKLKERYEPMGFVFTEDTFNPAKKQTRSSVSPM